MSSKKLEQYKDRILKAVESSKSMAEAATKANMAFSTFTRYAKELGVYKPNQAGKGLQKSKKKLEDVFSGKVHMVTSHLKLRLIREGHKEWKCEICGIDDWLGNPITLELDHISGHRSDNSLENLRILCPNCHSQTPTFRSSTKHNNINNI